MLKRWNELERFAEDLSRAASGDVSWNAFNDKMLKAFFDNYSIAVSPVVGANEAQARAYAGSLGQIRQLENDCLVPNGTYALAYNKLLSIYSALPWDDLRTMPPAQRGTAYYFFSPADKRLNHPQP